MKIRHGKDTAFPVNGKTAVSHFHIAGVQVEYTNHTEQDVCSYEDYLPDRPEELYLSLLDLIIKLIV